MHGERMKVTWLGSTAGIVPNSVLLYSHSSVYRRFVLKWSFFMFRINTHLIFKMLIISLYLTL